MFGAGQYAPGTVAGRTLLAHELAHVVQQQLTGSLTVQRQEVDQPPPETTPQPADKGNPSAPRPGVGPIAYPHEGQIVCNEEELCWKTVCDYSENGEQTCYWQSYVPPPPEFGEGEPRKGDVTCTETVCLKYRCHISSDGNWLCRWEFLDSFPAVLGTIRGESFGADVWSNFKYCMLIGGMPTFQCPWVRALW